MTFPTKQFADFFLHFVAKVTWILNPSSCSLWLELISFKSFIIFIGPSWPLSQSMVIDKTFHFCQWVLIWCEGKKFYVSGERRRFFKVSVIQRITTLSIETKEVLWRRVFSSWTTLPLPLVSKFQARLWKRANERTTLEQWSKGLLEAWRGRERERGRETRA